MEIEVMKKLVNDKYAWPGGYPMYLVMSDGEPMCCDCAIKEWNRIQESTVNHDKDGWAAECVDINYEDPECYCCHCNKKIESAYAD